MNLQSEEVAESMWEKYSSYPLLHKFFDGELVHNPQLNQVPEKYSFSKQVHVSPHDSGLHCSSHLSLSLKHGGVDLSLLLGKLPTHREGHRLVSNIPVPLTSEVEQNHLTLLDEFIVVNIVQGCAVSTT